jgi:Anti-sigma-K factor rskA/Putative zinc-finger
MNGHPQYAEALALYALGALDNPRELAELEAHLGTCGECRRELEALRADTALLALSAVGPKPPERARQRLLSAIAAEARVPKKIPQPYAVGRLHARWFSFVPVAVMLMLAVFSILLGLQVRTANREARAARAEVERMQAELARTNAELAHNKAVAELMHAPDAWPLTLVTTKTPPQPQMKVIYSQQKGALFLVASNTRPLPQDKVYELWLLPSDGGAPMAAGWFKPDEKGHGMMYHAMQSAGISAKGFAVTMEPAGGSQTPTMPIVFAPG